MTLFNSGTQNVFNSVSIGSNKTMSSAQKTAEVQSPPGDTVSCLRFSPESMQTTFLAATSWDNRIRIWEVQANGSTIPKAEQMHQGPVFGACWSTDGSKIFSVSADKTAQMWDLGSNTFAQVGVHDAPVKTAHFITAPNYSCLMTGSWDKRLRFWDTRQPQPILNLDLPERIYCADVHYPLALVGTAGRQIFVYNLENGPTQFNQLESPLKFQVSVSRNLLSFK
ncbi:mRNA export factor [Schistosoma bovis]|uniref:mRNA export factor n=2 Tax=Schistosoma TaxID=6181 RepID=A0A430QT51_SCHBO|nr:mRNA export factor [Schistosoma bovis]